MPKKLTIEDARKLAEENGGECLSQEYKNSNTKMEWRCEKGHIWKATIDNIKFRGAWCPECYYDKIRLTLDEAIQVAKERGGECLSSEYIDANKTQMKWQCKSGHVWSANFSRIKLGQWCPECRDDKRRLTLDEAIKVAKSRNGKCLSTKYRNLETKMKWQCENGHIWDASFGNIKYYRTWCPVCRNGKLKTQPKLYKIICDLFDGFEVEYNYKKFDWLKTKNGGVQEIDIFVHNKDSDFSLAIEYQGKQHFEPVRFGGISEERAIDKLDNLKKLDEQKKNKILASKDVKYFIEFTYLDNISIGSVKKKLIEEGVL